MKHKDKPEANEVGYPWGLAFGNSVEKPADGNRTEGMWRKWHFSKYTFSLQFRLLEP